MLHFTHNKYSTYQADADTQGAELWTQAMDEWGELNCKMSLSLPTRSDLRLRQLRRSTSAGDKVGRRGCRG